MKKILKWIKSKSSLQELEFKIKKYPISLVKVHFCTSILIFFSAIFIPVVLNPNASEQEIDMWGLFFLQFSLFWIFGMFVEISILSWFSTYRKNPLIFITGTFCFFLGIILYIAILIKTIDIFLYGGLLNYVFGVSSLFWFLLVVPLCMNATKIEKLKLISKKEQ